MRLFPRFILLGVMGAGSSMAQTSCINFPAGLIPLSSVAYVTSANFFGDHLVVGALANGTNTLSSIPLPAAETSAPSPDSSWIRRTVNRSRAALFRPIG